MNRAVTGLLTCCLVLALAAPLWAQVTTEKKPVDVYTRSVKIVLQTEPIDYKRAMENLNLARKYYPENGEVHFLLGTLFAERDEIDSMMAEFALAEKYWSEKEWGGKKKDVKDVLESKWLERFNRSVSLFGQADSLSDLSDTLSDRSAGDSLRGVIEIIHNDALERLRQCVVLRPFDFRGNSLRGMIYSRRGEPEKSLGEFVQAEQLFHRHEFEDSTTPWYDTAYFFAGAEGEPTDAFKEFQKKYKKLNEEKRTRYTNLLKFLQAAYFDTEDWEKCLIVSRRLFGLFPNDIGVLMTIANCFSNLQNEMEAFKWQETVVRRDPESKDTWFNLGSFFYNAAFNLTDSLANYEDILKEKPGDERARPLYLKNWQTSVENYARAVPRFAMVLEIDPKDVEPLRLMAMSVFSVASLMVEVQPRLHEGEDDAMMDAVWDVVVTEFHVERDNTALWMKSKEALTTATQAFPDDPVLCQMMKVTLARLGDREGIQEWLQRCP